MDKDSKGALIGSAISVLILGGVFIYNAGIKKGIRDANERISKELTKILDDTSVKIFDKVFEWEEVEEEVD